MDTFVEQIVVKRKGGKEWGIMAATVAGFVIVSAVALLFLQVFALIIIVALGYLAWWLITSQNIEFEYSVTNGDIDIDQIIAQRKRKRIVSVSGTKIESFQPYAPQEFANRKFDRQVMAAPSEQEEGLWCFTYHSKKNGHTLVIFQPEDRVIDALKSGLSKLLQLDINRKMSQKEKEAQDAPQNEVQ